MLNWTLAIPRLLAAEAVDVIVPETAAPEVGVVIETVGNVGLLVPVLARGVISHFGSKGKPYPAVLSDQQGCSWLRMVFQPADALNPPSLSA